MTMLKPKKNYYRHPLIILLIMLILSIMVAALYWQGLYGPYLLDDLQSIGPLQVSNVSFTKFISLTFQNETGPLGRPLSIASFILNHMAFGPEPFSYKAVNVGLHTIMGFVVGYFVYLILSLIRPQQKYKLTICLFTSVIWLIHPLQVSTVLYPVQRMTILCQLFVLLSINCYLNARLKQWQNKRAWVYFLLCGFNGVLAVAAKETALLLPFYLFILEYFVLDFKGHHLKTNQCLRRSYYISLLTMTVAGSSYFYYHFSLFMGLYADKPFNLLERLYTQANVLVFYLQQILFPRISEMGLYHDDFPINHRIDLSVLLSSALLVGLLVFAFRYKKRWPIPALGCAWFFVSHLLESTIFPLELVFEHRNYLASVGVILVPTYFLVTLAHSPKIKLKKFYPVLGCLYIAVLISMTWSRVHSWSSSELFLKNTLAFHPNSPRVHIEVANWYLNYGLYGSAFTQLNIAQALQPTNSGIALHKVLIHCHANGLPQDIFEEAKTNIQQYPITPYSILILDQLVTNIFEKKCNSISPNNALQIIQAAYKNPRLQYHPKYQAVLYHLEAGLQMRKNNTKDAIILLQKSYEAYPKRMQPLVVKAQIEMRTQDFDAAKQTVQILNQKYYTQYAPRQEIDQLKAALDLYAEAQGPTYEN
tara:strand:- start:89316 stop:91256 length:1941 start_codon:yes stop_codon:yes gene_type:complete